MAIDEGWGPPPQEAAAKPAPAAPAPDDWGWGPPATAAAAVEPPKAAQTPAANDGWGPAASATAQASGDGTEAPMPGIGTAISEGLEAGLRGVGQTVQSIGGTNPQVQKQSAAAAPLEWGDLASPVSKLAPKLAYSFAQSSPTIAGGVAGGLAGAAIPLPGTTLAGGAIGAGIGTIAQTLGPTFAEELQKDPNDPNGAWDRAVKRATVSGAFSGAGWGLFPVGKMLGPAKQMLFQAFGVQPAVSVGENAAQNYLSGKDLSEGAGSAYAHGFVGTAIPAAGHAILKMPFKERKPDLSDAQNTVLSRIGENDEGSRLPSWNKLYTDLKDDLNPIREARNILNEGNPKLAEHDDPYALARLTRGSYGKAEHFIDHGTFDPITKQDIGPGMKQIIEPIKNDMDGLRAYMLARRAVEKHAQGIETGVPIAEARQTIAETSNKFAKPFEQLRDYNRHLLDYLVKSGIVGKADRAKMEEMNKDYVPFYRVMDDAKGPAGSGQALGVRNPIKEMTGSGREILDPIESMIRNTYTFISLADRNMALSSLRDLAASSPKGKEILEKVPPQMRPIEVTPAEINRGIGHNGGPPINDPFTIFRPDAFRPAPDEIAIFNKGKREVFKTDPYLADAINGMNRESMNMLSKIIAAPARLLRAGATLTPEFTARNPVRDQFSAFIYSTLGRGYVPFYDFIKGMGSVLKQDKAYQNWLKSGGANSAMVSIDRNYVDNLVARMKDPTFMGTMKNVAKSPIELLRAASELMENATRVGESQRLLKRGLSHEQAGMAAREITLDFQRIGAKMQAVNASIAFFNAQVEGVDRTIRAAVANPLRFTATVAAAITAPSIGLWFANKDDPRMKEIPRWQKDIFWIIPTDKWEPISAQDAQRAPNGYTRQKPDGSWEINNGNIWRIPKPFELGVIFGSIPERILDAYYHKDPNAFKNIGPTVVGAFSPSFVPQIAAPIVEQFANRSLFTGRPLVPKYLEGQVAQYQAAPYTTETAKLIGKTVGAISKFMSNFIDTGGEDAKFASPMVIENYIRAWTGGLGKHALDTSDLTLKKMGLVPSRIEPAPTNADKAILKAFAVRWPDAGANSVQDFYEESAKRKKFKDTARYLQKNGAPEEGQAMLRDNVIGSAEGIQKAMNAQFKLVRDVYRNNNMSPQEKRRFIDMSYLQIIKMAQTGNEMFKKTEEAFKAGKQEKE